MNRKSILILICLLLSAVMPAAGAEPVDYSDMPLDQLYEIRKQVDLAIAEKLEEERKALYQTGDDAETYTFQGIPWGASPSETLDKLTENGILSETDTPDALSYFEAFVEDSSLGAPYACFYPDEADTDALEAAIRGQHLIEDIGCTVQLNDPANTFGGLDVNTITFSYLYGFEDGAADSGDLHLTLVHLQFENEASGKLLTERLCGKYGAYTARDAKNVSYRFWYGGNNTVIAAFIYVDPLTGAETEGIGYEPVLIYARTDDYLTVQKILSVQPNKTDAGL